MNESLIKAARVASRLEVVSDAANRPRQGAGGRGRFFWRLAVMMTAYGTVESAVEAMKAGAQASEGKQLLDRLDFSDLGTPLAGRPALIGSSCSPSTECSNPSRSCCQAG